MCGVPISLVSLIDHDRQWFKANVGLPGVTETPRDVAFCAHAIFDDGIFEVTESDQENKVPLLGDVPVLGNLFKQRTRQAQKQEMLVFITPKMISDRGGVR